MLFGVNPAAGLLIQALGIQNEAPEGWQERFDELSDDWGDIDLDTEEAKQLMAEAKEKGYYPTGRFRDIFFDNEDEANPKITLYTRNGGGNRDHYQYVFDLLRNHPLYMLDYDDDFDSTYAYIDFKAPQEVVDFFEGVKTGKLDNVHEKFEKEIKAMESGKEINPQIAIFMESVVNIINQVNKESKEEQQEQQEQQSTN